MRPLFPVLPFASDETPLSWAARQAAFHTGGRLAPFLNDFDLRLSALASGERDTVLRLCEIAGQDPAPVLRNTIAATGKRRYRLRDEDISVAFTTGPVTRYCPLCVKEDRASEPRPGAGLRHRIAWRLAPVRTCARHGLALVEARSGTWDDIAHELQVIVPRDEAALDSLAAAQAQRAPSPLQDWVLDRLAGRSGPDWLDAQGIEQAVRATEMLGAVLTFGPDRKAAEMTGQMWDAAGRAGWDVTAGGETAIRAALSELMETGPRSRGIARPRGCYGMLFSWLSASRLARDPGPIRDILRAHILDTVPVTRGHVVLGTPVTEPRVGTVASVAAAEGLHPLTLRNILVAKGVVPVSRQHDPCGNIIVRHAEVDPVVHRLKNAVPVTRLPTILGASRPLVAALLELGLLRRVQDQALLVSKWGKAVEGTDIDALRARLERDVAPVEAPSDQLVPLAKAAEKTRLRLTRILELLFAGRLTRARRLQNAEGFAAILVDPTEIKRLVETPRPGMRASLAFMMLGVSPTAGRRLIADGDGAPLLQSDGQGSDPWIGPEAMAAFRRTFAIKKRLSLETGLKSGRVHRSIKEHRVPPIFDPSRIGATIYRRSDLPEALTV